MSQNNFEESMKFVLKWEGGYSNDPLDPGGETNHGISKKSYPDLNIKLLSVDGAKNIYRIDYWNKMKCFDYDWPLCLFLFDTGVNLGTKRALKFLDKSKKNAYKFLLMRENFYLTLSDKFPKYKRFLKGWLRRCSALKELGFTKRGCK